ncbi:MAG: hypothetical protein LBS22_00815 [Puniceicoccales bacterium]|jgi:hypothetical protein|nr:hypothetical protein [Puniceicoccales bacterium]
MKKTLLMVSIVCGMVGLYAGEGITSPKQNFTVDGSVGFKSEHFSRGRNELHKVIASRIKMGYQAFDEITPYIGVSSTFGTKSPTLLNHISPCVGVLCNVADKVTLDAGCEYHFYTAIPSKKDNGQPSRIKRHSREVHLGITFDTFMKLSLTGFYDFDRKEALFEGVGEYNLDLSFLFSGLGIDAWAKVGYDCVSNPMGIENSGLPKTRYCYYGAGTDLAYRFNGVRVKVGVGYEKNLAKEEWVNRDVIDGKNMVLSASVDCSF